MRNWRRQGDYLVKLPGRYTVKVYRYAPGNLTGYRRRWRQLSSGRSVTGRIRVMIVDDHPVVRRALATFLRAMPDLELAGEASNGVDAVRICALIRPDVVLMDLHLPGIDGIAAARAIRAANPAIQVIAMTGPHDDEHVHAALRAAGIDFLRKDFAVPRLADAIRDAIANPKRLNPGS
jgi:two-component system, NarL family, response regulator LiaR